MAEMGKVVFDVFPGGRVPWNCSPKIPVGPSKGSLKDLDGAATSAIHPNRGDWDLW